VAIGRPGLGPLITPGRHGLEAAALGRSRPSTVCQFFVFLFLLEF
jgi:hypothetical protein